MKNNMKFLFGIMTSILCLTNVNATEFACPEGCFCLDNGVYSNTYYHNDVLARCGKGATLLPKDSPNSVSKLLTGVERYLDEEYFVTKTIKDEEQYINYYGVKNGTFYGDRISGNIFVCPATHPHSAKGSKTLTDCFQYDANGNKIYYGSKYVYKSTNRYSVNSVNIDIKKINTLVKDLQNTIDKANKMLQELQYAINNAEIVSSNNDYSDYVNEPVTDYTQDTYETTTKSGPFKSGILNSFAGAH